MPETYFTEKEREYLIRIHYFFQVKALIISKEFRDITPKYPEKILHLM